MTTTTNSLTIPLTFKAWTDTLSQRRAKTLPALQDVEKLYKEISHEMGNTGDVVLDRKLEKLVKMVIPKQNEWYAMQEAITRSNLHARLAIPFLGIAALAPHLPISDLLTHIAQGIGVSAAGGIAFFDTLTAGVMGKWGKRVIDQTKHISDDFFTPSEMEKLKNIKL